MRTKNVHLLVTNSQDTDEQTYELQDFPTATKSDEMKIHDFLNIATFPVNRAVEDRAKKAVVRLVQPMHKHSEVDILIYTGETTNTPAFFKKGAMYVLDGNTRQYCWNKHINGQVVSTKTTKIPIPNKVNVRYYELDDPYAAISLYRTIDSMEAVETKGNVLTGAFRAKNLLERFTSTKLKRGQIAGAMMIAAPFGPKQETVVPGIKDLYDQTEHLKEALVLFDKNDIPGKGHFHVQPTMGMAMLAGQAMEFDNRWLAAIEELRDINLKTLRLKPHTFSHPAIEMLALGNVENVVGVHNALPYDIGMGQAPTVVKNYLAYCWKCYIDDVKNISTDYYKDMVNAYPKLVNEVNDLE